MAKQTLQDCYIAINGTALSDHANSVTVNDVADQIDFTSFSPNAYKQFGQGMKDGSIDVIFFQDFAPLSVHSILQPLYQSGGTFGVEVRPTSAAAGTANPNIRLTARIYSYSGIAGKAGDAMEITTSLQNAGTAGLVWGTS